MLQTSQIRMRVRFLNQSSNNSHCIGMGIILSVCVCMCGENVLQCDCLSALMSLTVFSLISVHCIRQQDRTKSTTQTQTPYTHTHTHTHTHFSSHLFIHLAKGNGPFDIFILSLPFHRSREHQQQGYRVEFFGHRVFNKFQINSF